MSGADQLLTGGGVGGPCGRGRCDAALRDPTGPTGLSSADASIDDLHPGLAGHRATAAAVPLTLLGAGAARVPSS